MRRLVDISLSGAVSLGPDIVCDGFLHNSRARVQTHIHSDHMDGFESSKGCQEIFLSEPTRQLLILDYNADLPYRSNIRTLRSGESREVNRSRVSIVSSGHMLGSVQVLVESEEGERWGYSGDFTWPVDEVIEVDTLVVDSTYGSPRNIRNYTQGDCEAQFISLVKKLLVCHSVYIYAHRGSMQRALQLLSGELSCPVICGRHLCREIDVYRKFGYVIGEVVSQDSTEGITALQEPRLVRCFGYRDQRPVDPFEASVIKLSAYFTRPDTPVMQYSDRAYGVALSTHADFHGTLEYIRSTGARYVVTDNTRGGNGYELALEIKQRLGVEARPSTNSVRHGWGE